MTAIQISDFKQQLLWEKIIVDWLGKQEKIKNDDYANYSSLSLSTWQFAGKAREAWHILQLWQIPLSKIKKYFWHQETKVFLEWAHNYKLICEKFNYTEQLSEDILPDIKISNSYSDNNYQRKKDDYFKIACRDFIQEINNAACWALNQELIGNIGILVLDLDATYSQVDYIFSNFFSEFEYNIAIPVKLNTYSLINIALLILQIANCYITKDNITYEDFSRLLRTKFVGGEAIERNARSYIDYTLREKVDYKFSWQYIKNNLLNISQKNNIDNCSINIFIKLCDNFEQAINNRNLNNNLLNKNNCKYWVDFIQEMLQTFSWCKENINDTEQYIVYCWQDLLKEYGELENLLDEHDLTECIKILVKLSKSYNVVKKNITAHQQLKNKQHKNITIVDLSKALQSKFDYLWVCGLSEINWPNEYQFNPLLPIELQKEFGVPYGKMEQTIDVYNKYLKQLIDITDNQVICSYPLYFEDNLVRPSQLINDFPEFKNMEYIKSNVTAHSQHTSLLGYVTHWSSTSSNSTFLAKKYAGSGQLQSNQEIQFENKLKINPEIYTDDQSPKYQDNIFSGTKFLKLQVACPFQANAKVRLKAISLEKPIAYLSKAIKGEVLHKTLAQFWLKYKNSNVLKKLSTAIIKQELLTITNKILYNLQKIKPISLNAVILQLESLRISNLCFDFIQKYDLTRDEFSIIHLEEKFVVKLREFLINIKLDRVDQLAGGDLLVIDYKTGKVSMNVWNANSLDDPQLPVYSLCLANIKGLILAVIRSDKLELLGMLEHRLDLSDLPDIKYIYPPNWHEHLELWHENLYQLVTDFKNGVAIVDPKYGSITCRNCDLKYMCRVFAKNNLLYNNSIYE